MNKHSIENICSDILIQVKENFNYIIVSNDDFYETENKLRILEFVSKYKQYYILQKPEAYGIIDYLIIAEKTTNIL